MLMLFHRNIFEPCGLEGVPQSKLHLALVVSKRAGNRLTAGNIRIGARNLKLRMIEHVE